jgi:hypothetical protein
MGDTLDFVLQSFGVKLEPRQRQPIDIFTATRGDLANVFAELNFNVGAEIGVQRGEYSEVLLKANPGLKLYSIDSWKSYRDYRDHTSQQKLGRFHKEPVKRLAAYGRRSRIIQGFSLDAVKRFRRNDLDFVYIDGNHTFDWVIQDIIEWSRRVRSGGIVSGHDYIRRLNPSPGVNVIQATHAYVKAHGIKPWFTVGGATKETRSWFWVKP